MRRIKRVEVVTAILLLSGLAIGLLAQPVAADTNISPSLVLTQLKVTSSNGQFIMLFNTTDTVLDMSKYRLEYFNSYDLTKATSSKLITLTGSLPPHGYYLVNDSQMLLCYQLTVDSVSLGFSTVAGLIQVSNLIQNSPGSSASPVVQDYIGWSKTAVSGAQTLPSNTSAILLRQPVDAINNPVITTPGSGSWLSVQPDISNACNLVSLTSPTSKIVGMTSQLLPALPPPVTVLSAQTIEVSGISVNSGLMVPLITEILPNPIGTGNDAKDEFIELYNSNSTIFDLGGFSLQSGISSLHNFVFPTGTTLPALGYAVFYASSTGLSLSNTGGQVKLLDPSGASVSSTDVYDIAKDGLSWINANGIWSWTNALTPAASNVISQPIIVKINSQSKTNATPAYSAPITNSKTSNTTKPTSITMSPKPSVDSSSLMPIHNWTLALVAIAAILYGAYEYRADLGNRIHQFRKHFKHRRTDWSTFAWWRSNRASQ